MLDRIRNFFGDLSVSDLLDLVVLLACSAMFVHLCTGWLSAMLLLPMMYFTQLGMGVVLRTIVLNETTESTSVDIFVLTDEQHHEVAAHFARQLLEEGDDYETARVIVLSAKAMEEVAQELAAEPDSEPDSEPGSEPDSDKTQDHK